MKTKPLFPLVQISPENNFSFSFVPTGRHECFNQKSLLPRVIFEWRVIGGVHTSVF
jgi:hypothetical protein